MSKEMLYQRDVYGKTLVELGKQNPALVVLDADLSGSTRTSLFAREFPERFFNFGVAEQNMMAAAAGIASCNKTVFASTFAMFATGRVWDQVRNTICYSGANVKIVATHAGVTVGPDGATHQALEDIALMRVIPNMTVIVPGDGPQTRQAVLAAAAMKGPVYIRLGRAKVPTIEGNNDFRVGAANVLTRGKDITIIACGIMVEQAVLAADILRREGVEASVVNMATIKPLDEAVVAELARTGAGMVICEEHSTIGGLGCAVEEALLRMNCAVAVRRIGVHNRFGQSGDPDDLLREYHLTAQDIVRTAHEQISQR